MLKSVPYKYIVTIVYVVGLFMELLDTTIINVALPSIAHDLHVGAVELEWVASAYLLSIAVFIPMSGWAGDRFGTKRVFLFALGVFTAGSALCATSDSLSQLILWRVVQGIGGGMLTPVGMTMLMRAYPVKERGQATVWITLPILVAPATGPVLGGYLSQHVGWQSIFWINIPLGVLGFLFSLFALKKDENLVKRPFDTFGFLLVGGGLCLLTYALSTSTQEGLTSPHFLLSASVGTLCLLGYFLHSGRTRIPLIEREVFLDRNMILTICVQLSGMASFIGGIYALPLLLQVVLKFTPTEAGLMIFPQALGIGTMMPFAKRLVDKFGYYTVLKVGCIALTGFGIPLGFIDAATSPWTIRSMMFFRGWGFAILVVGLQLLAFASVPHAKMGQASTLFSAGRQFAGSLGIATVAAFLAARLQVHHAIIGSGANTGAALSAFSETMFFVAGLPLIAFVILVFAGRNPNDQNNTLTQKNS